MNITRSTRQPARTLLLITLILMSGLAIAEYSTGMLRGFDGSIHSLDEYTGQGQWTVVMLWASDCSACNAEARSYEKFHQAHKDSDARILGVSLDGRGKKTDAEAFISRHGITFNNLIDEPESVASMYTDLTGKSWIGTPTFLLFSPIGELRAAQVGAVPVEIIEKFIAKESAISR